MHRSKILNIIPIAFVVAAGCVASLFAQSGASAGSLAELTAEIRLLRAAVEQSSRTQTQAQALGIFLSAQQSRILQITARVDMARKEREAAVEQSSATARELARLEAGAPRATDPVERIALEQRTQELKVQMKSIATQEQESRAREAEMIQTWQQEEARWNDLIARLQQIAQP